MTNNTEGANALMTITRTECSTWFERDRAHVELRNASTGETIIEFWDEEVAELVEDGFLEPKNWHRSAREYAEYLGLLKESN
jgi:hypothetical protein